jgi:curli production assembly/transport component CsgG
LCVSEAIEAGVTHLIVQGIKAGNWTLKDEGDLSNPVVQRYLEQARDHRSAMRVPGAVRDDGAAGRVAAVSAGSEQ